jgi:hypothetical protein
VDKISVKKKKMIRIRKSQKIKRRSKLLKKTDLPRAKSSLTKRTKRQKMRIKIKVAKRKISLKTMIRRMLQLKSPKRK